LLVEKAQLILQLQSPELDPSFKVSGRDGYFVDDGDRFPGLDDPLGDDAVAENADDQDADGAHTPEEDPLYTPFLVEAGALLASQLLLRGTSNLLGHLLHLSV
jgi:hypothetical protein